MLYSQQQGQVDTHVHGTMILRSVSKARYIKAALCLFTQHAHLIEHTITLLNCTLQLVVGTARAISEFE
jgi:hypothetical protein